MLIPINKLLNCTANPNTNKPLKNAATFLVYKCPSCTKKFAVNEKYTKTKHANVSACKSCILTKRNIKHGETIRGKVTVLYRRWGAMKNRCNNPKDNHYHRYGGRGISVCKEWEDNFEVFKMWAESNGFSEELTIDRINVDGNYQPDNCRYVDNYIQASNTNKRIRNTSGYKGVTKNGQNKWQASVTVKYKKIYLGTYDSPKEAAQAYNKYVLINKLPHPITKGI